VSRPTHQPVIQPSRALEMPLPHVWPAPSATLADDGDILRQAAAGQVACRLSCSFEKVLTLNPRGITLAL
jgi:hypothetical protein